MKKVFRRATLFINNRERESIKIIFADDTYTYIDTTDGGVIHTAETPEELNTIYSEWIANCRTIAKGSKYWTPRSYAHIFLDGGTEED